MRHKNARRCSLAILAVPVLFLACNQDDGNTVTPTPTPDPVPAANCRIVSGQSGSVPLTFSYNSDKKLTAYEEGGSAPQKKTFTYYSGLIVGVQSTGGTDSHRDSIFINSAGYMTRFVYVPLPSGVASRFVNYTYNSAKQIQSASGQESGGSPFSISYEYNSAGDLAKSTQGTNVTTYEYYTDKAVRTGDIRHLQDLTTIGSGKILNSVHLLKSETTNGTSTTTYSYEYDSAGRIIKVTLTPPGGTSQIITLQQACD